MCLCVYLLAEQDIKSGRVYDILFDFSSVTNLFGFSDKTDFEIDGHLKCNFAFKLL